MFRPTERVCGAPKLGYSSVEGVGTKGKISSCASAGYADHLSHHPDLDGIGKIMPTCTLDAPST
jgi:hypothetical protein